MLVAAPPRVGPYIQGYENYLRETKIGDTVSLNCTSLKSKPAAHLEFFINGRKVGTEKRVYCVKVFPKKYF